MVNKEETMKRLAIFSLSLLAIIFVSLFADTHRIEAVIIYDNGVPDLIAGSPSDFAVPQQTGDDFTLNANANIITDIHWWGFYFQPPPQTDDFTIRIFNIDSVSGNPETTPSVYNNNVGTVTRTDTLTQITGYGFEVFQYSLDVDPISLTSGTPYLLSIVNSTGVAGESNKLWFWANSNSSSGNALIRFNDGEAFSQLLPLSEMAFNLTEQPVTPIPEPATILLLGSGLLGLIGLRKKLRN
jgi:hypothetical protein